MYNEQLENLIEMALIDGQITDKERSVLIKKAESFGIDIDEFEMVLDARLFEKQKTNTEPTKISSSNKSDKHGNVNKCPACGSLIKSFNTSCPDCDHDFSGIEANASIEKLFTMLTDVENERNDDDMSIGKAFGNLLNSAIQGTDSITSKKKTIISNFPIPTSKNDILEFLSLSLPKARERGNFITRNTDENRAHNEMAKVWKTKCEQIIMKARFSMKDDKKTLEEINMYAKELKL